MIGEQYRSQNLLSNEINKIKFEKEFRSFRNKFHGKNLIWFQSLSTQKQRLLLKEWKRYKWVRKDNNNEVKYIRSWSYSLSKYQWVKKINYRPRFKYFIKETQNQIYYKVSDQNMRDNTIEHLLNGKKNKK